MLTASYFRLPHPFEVFVLASSPVLYTWELCLPILPITAARSIWVIPLTNDG